jgi:hypothetical protein
VLVVVLQVFVDNRRLEQTGRLQPRPDLVVQFSLLFLVRFVLVHQQFRVFVADLLRLPVLLYRLHRRLTLARTLQILTLLAQVQVSEYRLLGHGRQVGGRVEVLEGEIHHFLGLHPLAVHVIETLQVDDLQAPKKNSNTLGISCCDSSTHQNRWQPPYLQFLRRRLLVLTIRTVIHRLQPLLRGERFQAVVEIDGFRVQLPTPADALVFDPQLKK